MDDVTSIWWLIYEKLHPPLFILNFQTQEKGTTRNHWWIANDKMSCKNIFMALAIKNSAWNCHRNIQKRIRHVHAMKFHNDKTEKDKNEIKKINLFDGFYFFAIIIQNKNILSSFISTLLHWHVKVIHTLKRNISGMSSSIRCWQRCFYT